MLQIAVLEGNVASRVEALSALRCLLCLFAQLAIFRHLHRCRLGFNLQRLKAVVTDVCHTTYVKQTRVKLRIATLARNNDNLHCEHRF